MSGGLPRWAIVVGVVIGFVGMAAAVGTLANAPEVSDGPRIGATDGPKVSAANANQIVMVDFAPDDQTVEVVADTGNATLRSDGHTNVTMTDIEGTYTNTTELDVAGTELQVDPADKPAINVTGETTKLNFTDPAADDGTVDFAYAGPSGETQVRVRGLTGSKDYIAVDSTGAVLDGNRSSPAGVVIFTLPNSNHAVTIQSSSGGPRLSDPDPIGPQSGFPTEINATVDDPDFGGSGDNVTVDFFIDGSQVGSDFTTSQGEVSVTGLSISRGDHTARAKATDQSGNTQEVSWTFSTPNNLTVRNRTANWGAINNTRVNFTFYEADGSIDTRFTTNGTIPLTGLNTGQQIVVDVSAEPANSNPRLRWHNSSFIIQDLSQQNDVYLLQKNESSVPVQFLLRDRTGGLFVENNATLFIERPINRTGTTEWDAIAADEFGPDGVTQELETNQRYRLVIKNDQGDRRALGTYQTNVSETVTLEVGTVSAGPTTPLGFRYNASYNQTASPRRVLVQYNDSQNQTSELWVEIFERGNESNVLFTNTSFGGPLGTVGITETVPNSEQNTTWAVKFTVVRGGEQIRVVQLVGPRQPVLQGLPPWLATFISVGTLLVVAGLFSQLNGAVGGLVVAGLGGLFWYVDMLPQEAGIGVVVLSMLVAALFMVRERDGVAT